MSKSLYRTWLAHLAKHTPKLRAERLEHSPHVLDLDSIEWAASYVLSEGRAALVRRVNELWDDWATTQQQAGGQ